jgi:2-keto-4-pentenoate hydratase
MALRVFISHSSKSEFASAVRDGVAKALSELGHDVLLDKSRLEPGDGWRQAPPMARYLQRGRHPLLAGCGGVGLGSQGSHHPHLAASAGAEAAVGSRARAAPSVGRKIGFTNPAMWDRYGVRDPIWGYVYEDTVSSAAACSVGRFTEPRIEPEIVLHFREAPSSGDPLKSIDWVAHGFELVQSPYPGWKFQAADAVAGGSLHAALILGPRVPLAELGSDPAKTLRDFSVTLLRDGQPVEAGKGANVLGGPIEAVRHLISLLATSSHPPVRAGELVTTGTLTNAPAVRPGEHWQTQLQGVALPGLSLGLVQ